MEKGWGHFECYAFSILAHQSSEFEMRKCEVALFTSTCMHDRLRLLIYFSFRCSVMSSRRFARLALDYLEDRTVPATLAALGSNNHLLIFDSATPATAASIPITGLQPDETLSGLDRWTVNGQLYAVGTRREMQYSLIFGPYQVFETTFYTINTSNGQATRVRATERDAEFSWDPPYHPGKVFTTLGTLNAANSLSARLFNVTGKQNESFTLKPTSYPDIFSSSATQGVPNTVTNGAALRYATGDINQGQALLLVDAAVQPAASLPTNMYYLDAQNGVLARQSLAPFFVGPPTELQTVGSLGITFTESGGFDIAPDGTAYAALTTAMGTQLYTINLNTGQATALGDIYGNSPVSGLVAISTGDQNQAPVITGPRNVLGLEDAPYTYSNATGNAITLTDSDAGQAEIFTAEIHSVVFPPNFIPNNGALYTLSTTAGLTFTQGDGTADNHMIFRGTLTAINAALDGIQVKTFYSDRFSQGFPESWGQLRISDTNTTHGGGPAVALHDFTIEFHPVDDGPPVAKPYQLTLPAGQNFVQQGVFDTDTFGVDFDEAYLLKARIVSVTQGVHGGQVSFLNPPPSQPFWANVYYERPVGFVGIDTFTYTITDGSGNFATATITVDAQGAPPAIQHVIAMGADRGNSPTVVVLNAQNQQEIASFQAFDAKFKSGVRVAVGDVNGDGRLDIVAAQARDGDGWVRAFTTDGQPLSGKWGQGIQPFGKTKQPLEIAVGDINGDGYADVAVSGLNKTTPVIRFFNGRNATLMGERVQPGLRGIFSFTLADLNNDQRADLIGFSSDGKKTAMLAYSGGLGAAMGIINPFNDLATGGRRDRTFRITGLSVAVGDIDGDGQADIVSAVTSQSGQSYLSAYSSSTGSKTTTTIEQPTRFKGSSALAARLALVDLDGDGTCEIVLGTSEGSGVAGDLQVLANSLTDLLFSQSQSTRWYRGFSVAAG